jgi:hypothetical protein
LLTQKKFWSSFPKKVSVSLLRSFFKIWLKFLFLASFDFLFGKRIWSKFIQNNFICASLFFLLTQKKGMTEAKENGLAAAIREQMLAKQKEANQKEGKEKKKEGEDRKRGIYIALEIQKAGDQLDDPIVMLGLSWGSELKDMHHVSFGFDHNPLTERQKKYLGEPLTHFLMEAKKKEPKTQWQIVWESLERLVGEYEQVVLCSQDPATTVTDLDMAFKRYLEKNVSFRSALAKAKDKPLLCVNPYERFGLLQTTAFQQILGSNVNVYERVHKLHATWNASDHAHLTLYAMSWASWVLTQIKQVDRTVMAVLQKEMTDLKMLAEEQQKAELLSSTLQEVEKSKEEAAAFEKDHQKLLHTVSKVLEDGANAPSSDTVP